VQDSVGSSGDDTFNGTVVAANTGTLNSFDKILGAGGTDTLNLAVSDATAALTIPTSITFSGIENVNLTRSGVATNTAAITDTTFGTGVQKLTLVDAGNNGAGVHAVTLASATDISVTSTATALGAVTLTDTDATSTATQGSTLKTVTLTKAASGAFNGNGIETVNINAVAGATTITSAAGTRDLTVNASGTTTQGTVTDAQATSATVNVTGAQTLGLVTVAKATEVTINTNAAAATSLSAAAATKLNLGGTNLNTLTVNAATVAATEVVITGAGGVAADLTPITALTSVDTTGSTAAAPASGVLTGANTLTIGTATALTGGAGQEVITVGATTKAVALGAGNDTAVVSVTALGTGGSITGGDGTDVLKLSNADAVTLSGANAVTTAFAAAVTGFETLDITAAAASTVNVARLAAFDTVKYTSADVAQIFSGVTSGFTIENIWAINAGTGGSGLAVNTLTGANDTITLKLGGDLSGGVRVIGDTVTFTGMENVNLEVADTAATHVARLATMTLIDAQAQDITISGNNGIALIHAGVALNNFDASGLTKGAVTYTAGALTTDVVVKGSVLGADTLDFGSALGKVTMTVAGGTNALTGSAAAANTITGGTGIDTITGGAVADVLVGGAGDDIILNTASGGATGGADTLTGGAGADTFTLIGSVAGTATGYTTVASVTDFVKGTDLLRFDSANGSYAAGLSVDGTAAGASGSVGVLTAAINVATDSAGSTTNELIKLTGIGGTVGAAFSTDVQGTFNAAIGSGTVTNLTAGTYLVSLYDVTNSKAVFLEAATADTTLETADVVRLIGTVDMTQASYNAITTADFANFL